MTDLSIACLQRGPRGPSALEFTLPCRLTTTCLRQGAGVGIKLSLGQSSAGI